MGFNLSEINEGELISLLVSNKDNSMCLNATLKEHLRNDIFLISIEYEDDRRLSFDNVQVDVQYCFDNDVPIIWRNVKIANYKNDYLIQATVEGIKNNRRGNFRIGVSAPAQLRIIGRGTEYVTIKDISLSGFAISTRKKDLTIDIGEQVAVAFDDLRFSINLTGRLVRTEERDDLLIFGFQITNVCQNLSLYLNTKQVQNRKHK